MNIFIVWTKYQSRVEGIVKDISDYSSPIKVVYRENPRTRFSIHKFLYYIAYIFQDLYTLLINKPSLIFVQVPPQYSLIAPLVYKKFFNKKSLIVADLHNSALRNPWIDRIFSKRLMSYADIKLVHNETVYNNIPEDLISNKNQEFHILEDKTEFNEVSWSEKTFNENEKEKLTIFFPASFNLDEPILEVVKAAKLNPDCMFILTGNKKKLKRNFNISMNELPENVEITGWIAKDKYDTLMQKCDILMGLTIYDDIQMSVSNEGLGNKKLMILSDTITLRYLYGNGAIYVENDSVSISKGIEFARKSKGKVITNMKKSRTRKDSRYKYQLEQLFNAIEEIK